MTEVITEYDIDFLVENFSRITAKRSYVKPSEYIEQVRYIDRALSPFPGKFSYDKFPYFREIINQFAPDSQTRRVYVMKGNQIGATTGILESVMMYYIGENPAAVLYVLPDEMMAKDAMATKIDPTIDNCGLRPLIYNQTRQARGSKKTGDTAMKKEYPGGYLHAVGAGSGNRFRNFSYKVGLVDEADGMQAKIKGEGSVYDLMVARLDAYPTSSKLYIGSTPAEEKSSLIWRLFQKGTQKFFYVPCKYCGEMQRLEFTVWDPADKSRKIGGIVWKQDENGIPDLSTVGYECPYCHKIMKNYDKAVIIPKGEWRATAQAVQPQTESYHITALYNPPGMFSWEDYVSAWAECWDLKNNKVRDKEKYRVFRNLKQGLPYLEQNEQIKYERAVLHRRFGFAMGTVPNKMAREDAGSNILLLVGSVDVQKNGLYVDIKGYADNGVTYTVDFMFLEGPTEQFGGPWDKLADIFDNKVYADDGEGENVKLYKVAILFVDSGHYTDWVYSFCQRFTSGVYACKGMDWIKGGETYQLFSNSTLNRIGLQLAYHVNTGKQKDRISVAMNVLRWNSGELQPAWYPNFPETLHDDYYKMFEAEEKVEVIDKNTGQWLKTIWRAKFGAPNHAFDTYVYNRTALEVLADDICRNEMGLRYLDWATFWNYAKTGAFYYSDKATEGPMLKGFSTEELAEQALKNGE